MSNCDGWNDELENPVCSKPYKHFYFQYLVFKILFTSVGIISYERLCFLQQEVGLVLVSRNSAAITLTSSLL